MDPVALRVGGLPGNAVRPSWALFNRRRGGIKSSLGPRGFVVTGGKAYLAQITLPAEASAAQLT